MLDQSYSKYQAIAQQKDSGKAFLEVEKARWRNVFRNYINILEDLLKLTDTRSQI